LEIESGERKKDEMREREEREGRKRLREKTIGFLTA
jgi:hypothetical protein